MANTFLSGTYAWRAIENRRFGPRIASTEVESPLFILGHWRSGTTHLHNLLAATQRLMDEALDACLPRPGEVPTAIPAAMRHAVEAVQIFGGYGMHREYEIERMMSDAKITQIFDGTSEILALMMGRDVVRGAAAY
jgi:hypothetical protein